MNRNKWIQEVVDEVTEVVAKGGRRRNHVSPYKKALNQANIATQKIITDPSDVNIRAWASKVLVKNLGIKALKLTDANVNDIRSAALLMTDISVYTPEQVNLRLVEAAKYSVNNATDQMATLITKLKMDAQKEKMSTQQMIHERIGNQLLLDMNNDSETHQKSVDTRRGMR